jgi:hypothetical protein
MKILLPSFLAAIVLLFTASCSKNNDDDLPPQQMSWSFDGGANIVSDTTSLLRLFGFYYVTGKKGTTAITLATDGVIPGTYSSTMATGSVTLGIAGTMYSQMSGSVTISSNANQRIAGSFTAVMINGALDTIDVAGSFKDVRYY